MMENKLTKNITILTSQCDHTASLSIPAVFSLFMDLASEHGTMIRLGADDLAEKGLFWLTVKTKVKVYQRPKLMEKVTAETWPEKPGKIRCNRYYRLCSGDAVCAEGKTEWAMIHKDTGKLCALAEAYPEDMEHCPEVVCENPYARISENFTDCEILDNYRVRSTDIDLGQHMNNSAYIRVFFGALSCNEWESLDIKEIDVIFRSPSFEGEILTICKRNTENGFDIGILHADGKAAVVARVQQ